MRKEINLLILCVLLSHYVVGVKSKHHKYEYDDDDEDAEDSIVIPEKEEKEIKDMNDKWKISKEFLPLTRRERKLLNRISRGRTHWKRKNKWGNYYTGHNGGHDRKGKGRGHGHGGGHRHGRGHGHRRSKRQSGSLKVRREYRNLTDSERQAFHVAVQQLKTRMVDDISMYDIFVDMHNAVSAPGAHGGVAFLPWHREFLYRFEKKLQEINPDVTLPYIDTCNERYIFNRFPDSALFDDDMIGNADGPVTSGPFSHFSIEGATCKAVGQTLRRNLRVDINNLFNKAKVNFITTRNSYDYLTKPMQQAAKTVEAYHGGFHVGLGGHMGWLECAPFDPVFFMHHCFVDYLWHRQQQHQQQMNVPLEYPDVASPDRADDLMKPFEETDDDGNTTPMYNRDGFSEEYMEDYTYQVAPCEIDCVNDEDCGASRLYCYKGRRHAHGTCRAKVRAGGKCQGNISRSCFCATGTANCNTVGNLRGFYCTCT